MPLAELHAFFISHPTHHVQYCCHWNRFYSAKNGTQRQFLSKPVQNHWKLPFQKLVVQNALVYPVLLNLFKLFAIYRNCKSILHPALNTFYVSVCVWSKQQLGDFLPCQCHKFRILTRRKALKVKCLSVRLVPKKSTLVSQNKMF